MNTQLLLPLLIVLLIIPMVLSARRQKRQMAEMQRLQSNLTEGDVVTTTSGLRGTVSDASYEDTIDLEIAPGVVTTWARAAVRDRVTESSEESGVEEPTASTAVEQVDSTASEAGAHRGSGEESHKGEGSHKR